MAEPTLAADGVEQEHSLGGRRPRLWFLLCAALLSTILLCLLVDAVFDRSFKNIEDGVAYLDISDAVAQGHWQALFNAYWSPAYPVVLSAGLKLLHPPPDRQLAAIYAINFAVALFALSSLAYFVRALPEPDSTPNRFALTRPMLLATALALFLISILADVPVQQITPDLLLGAWLWLAAGTLAHLSQRPRVHHYILLGVWLALAYFTKAVALPLALVALIVLAIAGGANVRRAVVGSAISLLVFLALVSPLLWRLSESKGRFTFGDTGALNYAWIVDGATRHEVQNDSPPGHARLRLLHPTRRLFDSPRVFEFASPVEGTLPVFDDPSYWQDGLTPAWYWKGEVWHVAMNLYHTLSWLGRRGGIVAGLLLLLLLQLRSRVPPAFRAILPVLIWSLALWGVYLMVDVEDRYVFEALTTVLLLLASAVRLPDSGGIRRIAAVCVALLVCGVAIRSMDSEFAKVFQDVKEGQIGPYRDPYWLEGDALRKKLNLSPKDSVACMGRGCNNVYWARLIGVRIVAEVGDDTSKYWDYGRGDRDRAMATLAAAGAKALVTRDLGEGAETEGWIPLGPDLYGRSTTAGDPRSN